VALLIAPIVVPVTFTVSVHEEPAANVPPPKFKVVSPGVAFHVPVQVEPMPGGSATFKPPGKLSLKFTPVSVTPGFGLVSVSVICDLPFSGMLVGLNARLTVGGAVAAWTGVAPGPPISPLPDTTIRTAKTSERTTAMHPPRPVLQWMTRPVAPARCSIVRA